jgi:hypothetical protein
LSFGRLFVAALLVSPPAGRGGSVLAVVADFPGSNGQYSENVIVTAIVLLSIGATFAILAGLLLAALPLTMILDRSGVPPLVRDLVLTAVAALAAWGFAWRFPAMDEALGLGLCYALVTSVLWLAALHLFAVRRARGPPA